MRTRSTAARKAAPELPEEAPDRTLDWTDIPPPASIVRAKRDGHLVKIAKPTLVIDSGESRGGYTFDRFAKWLAGTEQRRLAHGDYSVAGLEGKVTVERKGPLDAIRSVMPPTRADFLDRCARMARLQRKAIVIEASYSEMRSRGDIYEDSRAHPNAVVGTYLAIQERWGIPVYFVDEHPLAEEFVAHFLTKFYVRHWLIQAGLGDHFQDGDV
jgi:ERCC4-type nuclease